MVFEILNIVITNHYACLCKISNCSGDRKLGFLKPKKLRAVFVNSNFAARRSVAARRCACFFYHYCVDSTIIININVKNSVYHKQAQRRAATDRLAAKLELTKTALNSLGFKNPNFRSPEQLEILHRQA